MPFIFGALTKKIEIILQINPVSLLSEAFYTSLNMTVYGTDVLCENKTSLCIDLGDLKKIPKHIYFLLSSYYSIFYNPDVYRPTIIVREIADTGKKSSWVSTSVLRILMSIRHKQREISDTRKERSWVNPSLLRKSRPKEEVYGGRQQRSILKRSIKREVRLSSVLTDAASKNGFWNIWCKLHTVDSPSGPCLCCLSILKSYHLF